MFFLFHGRLLRFHPRLRRPPSPGSSVPRPAGRMRLAPRACSVDPWDPSGLDAAARGVLGMSDRKLAGIRRRRSPGSIDDDGGGHRARLGEPFTG